MEFLNRGIPAACICTQPFHSAAQTHARLLKWPGYEPVVIPHPLQTLNAELVDQRAAGIVADVVDRLTKPDMQPK